MMRHHFQLALVLALSGIGTGAGAGTACPAMFVSGVAPEILNIRMTPKTREVCFNAFAVVHSGITRTALWSAEHLTRASVFTAKEQVRVNAFHPETAIPASERSELSDYQRSGYDRGHLTPSGDAADPVDQEQTFSLANMVPQDPDNNRHLWAEIEASVRKLAMRRGELYVITGPLFEGATLQQLHHRVAVPTGLYKVVYDPKTRRAAAYVVRNEATREYTIVTVAELESRTGLRLFPGDASVSARPLLELPAPSGIRRGRDMGMAGHPVSLESAIRGLLKGRP